MYTKLSSMMALLITASMFLAACQRTAPTEADCTKAEVLCVGLITGLDGVNDKSFNQTAWEGLQKAQSEKVVDWVRYIETVDSKDYDQNIATLAEAGYDVIVTVGEQYNEATTTAAKRFPDTLFIGVDQRQGDVLPNLVGLIFHDDQSGFLAGALAAQMTKTGTIAGVFGADPVSSDMAFNKGFEAGAKYIIPQINIITTNYTDGSEMASTDARWGADTASQAIQDGADVVFGTGGKTGNGALIETANHEGPYCIGVDTDQWETIPEARPCLISSAMKMVTPGVFDIIKQAKDGTFPTGNYYGASSLAPYHDFDGTIPQAVKDKISQITTGLQDGFITTGYNPGG
jgi:basic membrane protein A and related proteins